MKRILLIVFSLFFFISVFFLVRNELTEKIARDISSLPFSSADLSPTPYQKVASPGEETTSAFVPYWTMSQGITGDEDRFIYFGVTPDRSGINENEEGYRRLEQFVHAVDQNKETYLTIRMLNQETNFDILDDPTLQERVITDSLALAEANGFDGIVLDLELKALPFDSVVSQINDFVTRFYSMSQDRDIHFAVATYGDTFYRLRPFDIGHISKNSDEVMIMAYDFHKSGGNPGPGFPLRGNETYGYDYYEMIDDYLAVVPPEKLTVIFGMFGYNWTVNADNVSIENQAESVSTLQGMSRYMDNCQFRSCTSRRDEASSEISVSYTDEENQKRIVWFEDTQSVAKKKEFLKDRGISSFSYWAYSFY